ncbi:hypothetical protein MPPM_2180 [Methylorubrum populi]|uniref:DUF4339 domain-containing protein n=1 Tax=Methylorubrum populi TaxID=223967 RepID=A0A160PE98_9HYPH|nr:hypothetical protein [Methylorubrum populi]BAU90785.1 hypothetical protein MPPM_2180 [Methylorubrum populi]
MTDSRATAPDEPGTARPVGRPDASPWWRLDRFGRVRGPFGEAEMRADLAKGRVRLSDPIWSPGVPGWGSFDDRFPDGPAGGPRPPLGAFLFTLVAFVAAAAAVILPVCGVLLWDVADLPSLPVLRAAYAGLAVAMGALTIAAAWSARRCAMRLRRRPGRRRALRMASVGLVGIGCLLTVLQGIFTAVVPDDLVDVAGWSFTVTRATAPDRIVIDGDVGFGFEKAVLGALASFPDPVRIEINSGGGLVTEALGVAAVLEKRPGATVIARQTCESACTLVLMAGTHRLADRDMRIGFHALSIVDAEEKRGSLFGFNLALAVADRLGDDFLKRRGVPPEIIAEANRRGHEGMYEVDSETLLERGALTGLVDPLPQSPAEDPVEDTPGGIREDDGPKAGKPD